VLSSGFLYVSSLRSRACARLTNNRCGPQVATKSCQVGALPRCSLVDVRGDERRTTDPLATFVTKKVIRDCLRHVKTRKLKKTQEEQTMRKAIMTLVALMLMAVPATALAQASDGSVTVVHGIPDLTVDVYVNDALTLEDFEYGTVTDPLTLPAADYQIDIRAADADAASDPVLSQMVTLPAGANASIEANLDGAGAPKISVWVNDISTIAAGNGRVTVRHTAAAPNVDILANDSALFSNVANGSEGVADVPAADYNVKVTAAGDAATVVTEVPALTIPEGTNVIVYAIGDLTAGNFQLAVQTIDGLHTPPTGVPSGTGGDLGSGIPLWLFASLGAAALLLVAGTVKSARQNG